MNFSRKVMLYVPLFSSPLLSFLFFVASSFMPKPNSSLTDIQKQETHLTSILVHPTQLLASCALTRLRGQVLPVQFKDRDRTSQSWWSTLSAKDQQEYSCTRVPGEKRLLHSSRLEYEDEGVSRVEKTPEREYALQVPFSASKRHNHVSWNARYLFLVCAVQGIELCRTYNDCKSCRSNPIQNLNFVITSLLLSNGRFLWIVMYLERAFVIQPGHFSWKGLRMR